MDKKEKALMKALDRRREKSVPESVYLTEMKDKKNVLEVEDLCAGFFTDEGQVRSVDGVSFCVPAGKTVGIVGESGCGKSVTSLSVMQLLQRPQGQILSGSLRLNLGHKAWELTKTPERIMQTLRGNVISMVFQEPMTALNPVLRIGSQVEEVLALHGPAEDAQQRRQRTMELLSSVGIHNAQQVYRQYPHDLSGGMRQRVCIAMALACRPRLIIADEPTTALDVTIQAQILALLRQQKAQTHSAIMLITHDLGVVAAMADLVVVMYAGRVVEQGLVEEIFYQPAHPYTVALMKAKPVVGRFAERLYSIPGSVPNPIQLPKNCYYHQRCDRRFGPCEGEYPAQIRLSPTHTVSCYRAGEDTHG